MKQLRSDKKIDIPNALQNVESLHNARRLNVTTKIVSSVSLLQLNQVNIADLRRTVLRNVSCRLRRGKKKAGDGGADICV